MINIQILEENDVITEECWYRPLNLIEGYYSDIVDFGDYNRPFNRTKWLLVGVYAGGFVGKTVSEVNIPQKSNCISDVKWYYEFALGEIPEYSIDSDHRVLFKKFAVGKYKDWFVDRVKQIDSQYVDWYNNYVRKYTYPESLIAESLLKFNEEYNQQSNEYFVEKKYYA